MADKDKNKAEKDKINAKNVDYMHPDGQESRMPRSKEERHNELVAKESTEIAKKLKPEEGEKEQPLSSEA